MIENSKEDKDKHNKTFNNGTVVKPAKVPKINTDN